MACAKYTLKKEEGKGRRKKKWMGNQTPSNCQHRVEVGVLNPK
ncbi:hypothetical protein [Okeania sp. SIO1I7]|nr:hypothetical protein [Okeania sp. SIO1I7]